MMRDDTFCAHVWACADSMAVGDYEDIESQRGCRPDGGVDAEIGCPSGYEDTPGAELIESGLQGCFVKGVVQGLHYGAVRRLLVNRAQYCPSWSGGRERAVWRAIVLHENDTTAAAPYSLGEAIDALHHSGEIMFLLAQEKSLLHVDDQKHINRTGSHYLITQRG
jgi:hypothetical protein